MREVKFSVWKLIWKNEICFLRGAWHCACVTFVTSRDDGIRSYFLCLKNSDDTSNSAIYLFFFYNNILCKFPTVSTSTDPLPFKLISKLIPFKWFLNCYFDKHNYWIFLQQIIIFSPLFVKSIFNIYNNL